MTDLFAELEWRGFVHHATPGLKAHLAKGPVSAYCGFDPTAPSLQLGNLMPIMLLLQLQRAGHRPIAVMGGGTGLIGDPSGKRAERPLLTPQQITEHVQRMRDQMAQFLDFDPGPAAALLVDNAKWLVAQKLVDFLRDIGKHFSVNVMLQKESVQARLEGGLSYTEFSYMLLQAYDYLHLYRKERCTLQVGGSDQWGNITAGVDLIRRLENGEAHGLVAPLVTTAAGAKFGKSDAGAAIYLDPALTSPYRFYQFWVNVDDRDVESYLKLFTLKPREEIKQLLPEHKKNPGARTAQRELARDVTERVHGEAARSAMVAAEILFGDFDPRNASGSVFATLAQEIPTASVSNNDALTLIDAVVRSGLATSKGEARRAIDQGGVYVNQQRIKAVDKHIDPSDWLADGHLLLRKGKKEYALLRRS